MEVLSVDYSASNAPAKFTQSIRASGFGIVRQPPIEKALVDEANADWQKFFSDSRKFDYHFAEETQDGFFPTHISEKANELDVKEYYHYYPWGKHPEFLGSATGELYRQLSQLAGTFLQWLEENTPPEICAQFSMPLSEMIVDSPKTLLRILNYPYVSDKNPKGVVRVGEHTDRNLITLLPAPMEMGLQRQTASGEWHDIPCEEGSIIVNIADSLQNATGGYFPSVLHRVYPKSDAAQKPRMAMPLYLHARADLK
ncbi:MAG: isopenicillin N synthase family oxygenase [Pseudomonadota bacterium]|nr:isopenicillin N synthase family oxygenase [Pseudomonadota bacterium]